MCEIKDALILLSTGYDSYLLMDFTTKHNIRPSQALFSGSKLQYVCFPQPYNLKMLDSMSFLPCALAALPRTFGFTESKKGWFPHFAVTKTNMDHEGDYFSTDDYGMNDMKPGVRKEFLEWYEANKHKQFKMKEEMLAYCRYVENHVYLELYDRVTGYVESVHARA